MRENVTLYRIVEPFNKEPQLVSVVATKVTAAYICYASRTEGSGFMLREPAEQLGRWVFESASRAWESYIVSKQEQIEKARVEIDRATRRMVHAQLSLKEVK